VGFNAEAATEGGQPLGNRPMTSTAVRENANEDAENQNAKCCEIERHGGPVRNHIGGCSDKHDSSLAEERRTHVTATIGHSITESESTMLFANVTLTPSTTALPGSAALQQIADGIAAWALIGALIALLIGAALWAVGSHTQNMHQSASGRRAVGTSLVAAVLIGAAPSLINFFFNAGLSVH
jgi:hypothetical protein